MAKKIIIVGGVGGGATTAAQIRRQDKNTEIVLFDKGEYVSFSTCGMPYYIGNIVNKRADLLVETDTFANKYGVTVRTNTEVTAIHRSSKQIQYKNENGTYLESYDKLVLSPGASAIIPDMEGVNQESVFTLNTVPDMDHIHAFIE